MKSFKSIFNKILSCFKPSQQHVFGTSYLDFVPLEVICAIMSIVNLKDRKNFVVAFPRYQNLAQSPVFGTRVITRCDKDMKTRDLSKVLDSDGTEIKIQCLVLDCKLYKQKVFRNFEIFQLMPKLERVVLKNCKIYPGLYTYLLSRERAFPESKFWKLLSSRVKYLTIDSCSLGGRDSQDGDVWQEFFKECFTHFWQTVSLQEVVFMYTLLFRDFRSLMRQLGLAVNRGIALQVEAPHEETLKIKDLTRDIHVDGGGAFDVSLPQLLNLLGEVLRCTGDGRSCDTESRRCHKLKISRGVCGSLIVILTV